jgi:hypothetical protein
LKKIRTLIVRFKNIIGQHEIHLFRAAIVGMLRQNNILFHNHTNDGLRYAYPLIQYKRINGKAAIVCIEEGTESIGEFFSGFGGMAQIGNREVMLELDNVKVEQTLMQEWDSLFTYSIRKWLPFNSENFEKYQQTEGLKDKMEIMEKILIGNILSFAKGVGIHFEKEVLCTITDLTSVGMLRYKDVDFDAYDAHFKTNVLLPNYAGLGKGVSHGFGMVVRLCSPQRVITK